MVSYLLVQSSDMKEKLTYLKKKKSVIDLSYVYPVKKKNDIPCYDAYQLVETRIITKKHPYISPNLIFKAGPFFYNLYFSIVEINDKCF